jgi:hypothetical protein
MTNIMNKRAQAVLMGGVGCFTYCNYPNPPKALIAVLGFAAQNPGLDFANYGDVTAYRSDSRHITKAWQDVKQAVTKCCYAGVIDSDILEASRITFSGRLSVESFNNPSGSLNYRVDYCTGQYWPTEYRYAAAAVLEQAARIALRRNEQVQQ